MYDGGMRDGQPHGQGLLKSRSGDIYEGEFVYGKQQGEGRLKWAKDGRVYEGSFENDEINGYGTFTSSDGCVYRGNYKDGRKNGLGLCTWSDGRSYEGYWKNGR